MSSKISVLFVCLALASCCDGLDICGLQLVPKCTLTDTDCVEVLESSLRTWFQTPEADGYFIKPVDPLTVDQIDVEVNNRRISLKDVSIKGIAESNISIALIPPNILEDTYTHSLILTASNYVVKNCDGTENESDEPVTIYFRDVTTIANVPCGKKSRCTGTVYLSLKPQKILVDGGDATTKGINFKDLGVDEDDFHEAIVEKVAKLSTGAVYASQIQLTSIVPFHAMFKD